MFDDLKRRGVPMRLVGADARPRAGGAAMSWMTWVLILTGVGLNAAAQLLLKVATRPLAHFSRVQRRYSEQQRGDPARSSPPFWAGMVCYAASVCVWLAALSKAPVSTAYPMLSLGLRGRGRRVGACGWARAAARQGAAALR